MRNVLEQAKIGNGARQLEFTILGGGHGQVDADEAGREDHENAESRRELPSRQRKPLGLGLLSGGPIVLLCTLLIPQPPRVPHQISWSRHVRFARAPIQR